MTMQFILSQFTALVAWIFFVFSYHTKRENKIILFQMISGLFYSVSYICAGANTGFLISLFETIIAFCYFKTDKDKYIYLATIPVYIIIGYLSSNSDGFFVLVPIIASIIDGYGMIRNNKIIVLTGIISNFLWIFYDIYYLEYITALGDLILVISNLSIVIYGIYIYFKRSGVRITIPNKLNDNEILAIQKLDEEYYDYVYRWDENKLKELYNKENDSYIIIRHKKNIVGYANFLNIDENIYKNVINSNEMIDNYIDDDIKKYNKNEFLYINLNSIVLKREYNNKAIVKRFERKINKYINDKIKNNYKIKELFIYVVNEFEQNIVNNLGYNLIKKISEECILYKKTI